MDKCSSEKNKIALSRPAVFQSQTECMHSKTVCADVQNASKLYPMTDLLVTNYMFAAHSP